MRVALYITVIVFINALLAVNCWLDSKAMRRENENMRRTITAMYQQQTKSAAAIRQIKTDNEIILRLAAGGDFVEVE